MLAADIELWSLSFHSNFLKPNLLPTSSVHVRVQARWQAPSPSWFKINSDAAMDFDLKRVGFGIVIRDCHGQVWRFLTQRYPFLVLVEVAEAVAIFLDLQFATEIGIGQLGIESNASTLISLINAEDTHLSDMGLIISDIIQFKIFLFIKHVLFVFRM
ncbi:hypothetical protein ACOSP7_009398 [Xanthoceras sorbifolium]